MENEVALVLLEDLHSNNEVASCVRGVSQKDGPSLYATVLVATPGYSGMSPRA